MRGIGRAGVLGDERLEVGLEKAAINAVMAGCRTEYFPVVVAALEAMFDEAFNLHTVLTSTGPLVSPAHSRPSSILSLSW